MSIAKIIKADENDSNEFCGDVKVDVDNSDIKEECKLYNHFMSTDGKRIIKVNYMCNGKVKSLFLTVETAKALFGLTPAYDENDNPIEVKKDDEDKSASDIHINAPDDINNDTPKKKENIFRRFLNIFS